MDLGSILLMLAVIILVGLFVSRPFFQREAAARGMNGTAEREHQRSSLLADRDRILNALQDLDFDYALGKIPAEDYPIQRAALVQEGAGVLRKLDEFQSGSGRESAESRLEAAVAARRADARTANPAAPEVKAVSDEDLEELIAARRQSKAENTAGFCPKCGKPVQKSDRFCPKCGKALA